MRITSASLASLAGQCRDLHTLGLAKCYKVADPGLLALTMGGAGTGGGPGPCLRQLSLRQCPKVTRAGLLAGSRLVGLDLSGCVQVGGGRGRVL